MSVAGRANMIYMCITLLGRSLSTEQEKSNNRHFVTWIGLICSFLHGNGLLQARNGPAWGACAAASYGPRGTHLGLWAASRTSNHDQKLYHIFAKKTAVLWASTLQLRATRSLLCSFDAESIELPIGWRKPMIGSTHPTKPENQKKFGSRLWKSLWTKKFQCTGPKIRPPDFGTNRSGGRCWSLFSVAAYGALQYSWRYDRFKIFAIRISGSIL